MSASIKPNTSSGNCAGPAWHAVLTLAFVLGLGLINLGCSLSSGTLGGREKCWPATEQRAPSIWRGILRVDASGGRLDTPEGDVIRLLPGALSVRADTGEIVRGSDVVARAGDDITVFGGAGSDGALVLCGLEEVHAPS